MAWTRLEPLIQCIVHVWWFVRCRLFCLPARSTLCHQDVACHIDRLLSWTIKLVLIRIICIGVFNGEDLHCMDSRSDLRRPIKNQMLISIATVFCYNKIVEVNIFPSLQCFLYYHWRVLFTHLQKVFTHWIFAVMQRIRIPYIVANDGQCHLYALFITFQRFSHRKLTFCHQFI